MWDEEEGRTRDLLEMWVEFEEGARHVGREWRDSYGPWQCATWMEGPHVNRRATTRARMGVQHPRNGGRGVGAGARCIRTPAEAKGRGADGARQR